MPHITDCEGGAGPPLWTPPHPEGPEVNAFQGRPAPPFANRQQVGLLDKKEGSAMARAISLVIATGIFLTLSLIAACASADGLYITN